MPMLPDDDPALVVRTDYRDEAGWTAVRDTVVEPSEEGFEALVQFVEDPGLADLSVDELLALVPPDSPHTFLLVVDRVALTTPGNPLLVVDLLHSRGASFRALPGEVQGIENNLSISNLDFEDFAGAVGADGVFRGF